MTSSALFIIVAESTETLRPIDQLGCAQASAGVTSARDAASRVRNGPPDAVRIICSAFPCVLDIDKSRCVRYQSAAIWRDDGGPRPSAARRTSQALPCWPAEAVYRRAPPQA